MRRYVLQGLLAGAGLLLLAGLAMRFTNLLQFASIMSLGAFPAL